MAVLEGIKNLRRVERPWWLAVVACSGAVVLGHFLRAAQYRIESAGLVER